MAVDHRMETGSIFKIYFACNQYDQHFLVVLWIVNKKINPSYKLGWTILILCFPVLVFPCIFFW